MLRRSPLWLLLLAGSVFPLSCSEGSEPGTDSATGGKGTASGGGATDISLDSSTGASGAMGGASGSVSACMSFRGLENCGSDNISAETTPVNILLVIDKSGSMGFPPTASSTTTLWDATTQAIGTALEDANDAVSFGLELYPAATAMSGCTGTNCCAMPTDEDMDVDIASGKDTRDAIATALTRTAPGGGTPTAAALGRAFQYFSTGPGKDLKGDRFVLLATDGGPNCNSEITCDADSCTQNIDGKCTAAGVNCCGGQNSISCLDDANTLAQIEMLRDIDVDTFVVGLAGTEQYADQLDSFAVAGGRPRVGTPEKYFKVEASGSADGLAQVLDEITTQLVQTCDIQLAFEPAAPDEINVAVDCNVITQSAAPGDGQGGQGGQGGADSGASYWWLDQATSPPSVHLGGAVCAQIQKSGVERIDIITGCPTVR